MFLYETIVKELNEYPLTFNNLFLPKSLVLEITKQCTNECAHCANYSSPQATDFMDITFIKKIIDQAIEAKHSQIALWGGEPFLHKQIYSIIEYCLQNKLNTSVVTNAFWAGTQQAACNILDCLNHLIEKYQMKISLLISCDKFHQEQKATPLQNIINCIKALMRKNMLIDYVIQSVKIEENSVLKNLLYLAKDQIGEMSIREIESAWKEVPLEYAVGRAKMLIPQDLCLTDNQQCLDEYPWVENPNTMLFVTVSGEVVLCESWTGEKIFVLGNLLERHLEEIVQNLNKQNFLKLLYFYPRKYFVYPFRKYLDFRRWREWNYRNVPGVFNDLVARLMQVKDAQFNKLTDLQYARRVYIAEYSVSQSLESLNTIEQYGDILDVWCLEKMLLKTKNEKIYNKVQELLANTFAYNLCSW
ncbi:MAG: radical SAM protein [Bacteroidales bacterium]|jgi:sulfatase maturation enzyme AslB (radical SAM superfamily)|nr:radical SAM protein [Bacteroidales bacterium]